MPTSKAKKAREQQVTSELLFALDLERRGLVEEAERRLLAILNRGASDWRTLHQLGGLYLARGDYPRALEFMAQAMRANPASAEAKSNHGFILQKLHRHEEALISFSQALVAKPGHRSALLNRGTSLHHLGRLPEALASFERVLATDPGNVKALYNRACLLHELHRFDEALAGFAEVIARAPDYADAHWSEGTTRLLLGQFERGWEKYEWRWKSETQPPARREFASPLWRGDSLSGKTILVHAEQGLGDTLQFIRYVPQLAVDAGNVIVEVQPKLRTLLSDMNGVRLVARGEPLPAFDLHCPMLSLPAALKCRAETIPADVPYLRAPADRVRAWRERLPRRGKSRIALAWAGNTDHRQDRWRSIRLAALEPLLTARGGIEWLSVQKELRPGDRELLAGYSHVRHLGDDLDDFADTAAVLVDADLVITVDTAVAHLSGALGRPAWIMLQHTPDFRWLLDRDDTPWYPTARLFRQTRFNDWEAVIGRVAEALQQMHRSLAPISANG